MKKKFLDLSSQRGVRIANSIIQAYGYVFIPDYAHIETGATHIKGWNDVLYNYEVEYH